MPHTKGLLPGLVFQKYFVMIGICLTVGTKQQCLWWAGFESCVTTLPSHSVSSKDAEGAPGEDGAGRV